MEARFHSELVRIVGSSKCTQTVVRALCQLTSGRAVYLDGVTLEMLQGLLPDAVSNSIHQSLRLYFETRTESPPEIPLLANDGLRSILDTFMKTGTVALCQPNPMFAFATGFSSPPDPNNLYDLLEQLHDNSMAGTNIAAVPTDMTQSDVQAVQHVMLLNTYVNCAAMRSVCQAKPDGWDIGDPSEAAQLVKTSANSIFRVLSSGMASLLSLTSSTTESMSKRTRAADLHMEFLSEIFKDFAFPAKTLKQLDGIMTNVVKQLGNIKLGFSSSSETLDHLLNVYYLEEVEGTNYRVPKLRLFYLHIDQSSWKASVLKSTFEKFDFHMNYIDMIFDMTWQPGPHEIKSLQRMLSEWTNRDFEELQRKFAPNAVQY